MPDGRLFQLCDLTNSGSEPAQLMTYEFLGLDKKVLALYQREDGGGRIRRAESLQAKPGGEFRA